jgi:hypothetical protein
MDGYEAERQKEQEYFRSVVELNLRFKQAEQLIYENFLRQHANEISAPTVLEIQDYDSGHMRVVAQHNTEQESDITEHGLNIEELAKTIAHVNAQADDFGLIHSALVLNAVKRDGQTGSLALASQYSTEVFKPFKDLRERYTRELGAVNERHSLAGLNEKLGIRPRERSRLM